VDLVPQRQQLGGDARAEWFRFLGTPAEAIAYFRERRDAGLRRTGIEILGMGAGSAPPREAMIESLHEQLALLAAGELRVEVDRVLLSRVSELWTSDQAGSRVVFVP
jgi:hypothetical protein